ncbi:hypothetical protein Tco_0259668 [Tanacetum coccineum]
MAENSSLDITPKEEPVTLDRPESPNLFLPATQVEFTFNEITFTTNNEVALIYPSHPNQEYFMVYTAKTLEDSKVWVSTPTGRVTGEIGITAFRNAIRAHYLPHSSMYVPPLSLTTIRPWFATIGYNREIRAKGTLKKSCLPPRWRLLMGQIIQCLGRKTGDLDQISNKYATILYCLANGVQVDYAKIIGKETKSSLATDTSPSHPSPPTPMVGEMHKDAQQAAGGPTSLGATSEEGAHPYLSSGHDTSADSTAEADPGLYAPNDSIFS